MARLPPLICAFLGLVLVHSQSQQPTVPQQSSSGIEEQRERLADSEAAATEEKLTAEEASLSEEADLENEMDNVKLVTRRRAEERASCDAEVNTLGVTDATLTDALNSSVERAKIRETRTKMYAEAGQSVNEVTRKAKSTLDVVQSTLRNELRKENAKGISGENLFNDDGFQQAPASQISGLLAMSKNLDELMDRHVETNDGDTQVTASVLDCPACEITNGKLQQLSAKVKIDLESRRTTCRILSEGHRVLDEAAKDRLVTIKKALEQLATTRRLRSTAEAEAELQRKQANRIANELGRKG